MSQLRDLAKPFAAQLVNKAPKGKYGSYVSHDVVNQKLLAVLGPFDYEIIEVLRGEHGIEGCLARITCEIDGRRTTVVEVGDCEQPGNWKTDGQRLKDASSDALKRCAMRLGAGLHLWSGEQFFLHDYLLKSEESRRVQASSDVASSARRATKEGTATASAVPSTIEGAA